MYKDEAEKMLCNYSAVPDTPEMERIKSTQKNISAVSNSDFLFTCNFSDIFSLNRLSSAQHEVGNVWVNVLWSICIIFLAKTVSLISFSKKKKKN